MVINECRSFSRKRSDSLCSLLSCIYCDYKWLKLIIINIQFIADTERIYLPPRRYSESDQTCKLTGSLNKPCWWFRAVRIEWVRCVAGVLADVPEFPAGPVGPLESFISKWVPSAGLLWWRWRWTEIWDTLFMQNSCLLLENWRSTVHTLSEDAEWVYVYDQYVSINNPINPLNVPIISTLVAVKRIYLSLCWKLESLLA